MEDIKESNEQQPKTVTLADGRSVPVTELLDVYKDVVEQVESGVYLSLNYVKHETRLAGIAFAVRTLSRAEQEYINNQAPISLYNDEHLISEIYKLAQQNPEEADSVGRLMDVFATKSGVLSHHELLTVFFGLMKYRDTEFKVTNYDFSKSLDNQKSDKIIEEKIKLLGDLPPTIFRKIVNTIINTTIAYTTAVESLEEQGSPF